MADIFAELDKRIEQAKGKQIIRVEQPDFVEAKRFTRNNVVKEKAKPVVEPKGYRALHGDQKDVLLYLRDEIINKAKLISFDYETNANIDVETQGQQDTHIVGMSFAFQRGQAFYLPIRHKYHDKNWDVDWLVENFIRPILLHPDVTLIAHNFQFEWTATILDFGIDFYHKAENRKVVDTMYLVKAVAPDQCMYQSGEGKKLAVGLKEAAKSLLADENGVIHGLLHVDDVKEFEEMVQVDEIVGYLKSGPNKGKPKYAKKVITFDERDVDQETINYACADSDWALGLYHLLYPIAEREGLLDVLHEMDFHLSMISAEYQLTGWHVSKERLNALQEKAEENLNGENGLKARLQETLVETVKDHAKIMPDGTVVVPAGFYPMGVWREEEVYLEIKEDKEFSWTSIPCLQWLFFHVLNLPLKGMERSKKTGLPSTNKENMDKLIDWYADRAPLLKLLKEKKKYDKIISTYVEGMGKYVREDTGRIHTTFRRVDTWRWSSSKPNLQNIPRADNDPMGIRSVFVAPTYDLTKDYSHLHEHVRPIPYIITHKLSGETFLIGCDYSQIELKVLAWYAMEEAMIKTLANGGDLHSVVAYEVFKPVYEEGEKKGQRIPVEDIKNAAKPKRYAAKRVNFGIVYGMTEHGLSKDPKMGMTLEEAKAFIEQYMNTYPGIRKYAQEQIEFAKRHGYVQTMFGHRRNIPEINDPNPWIQQSARNKAMNTPIQGSAADIINLAMVRLKKEIPKRAPYLRPVMQIHDKVLS